MVDSVEPAGFEVTPKLNFGAAASLVAPAGAAEAVAADGVADGFAKENNGAVGAGAAPEAAAVEPDAAGTGGPNRDSNDEAPVEGACAGFSSALLAVEVGGAPQENAGFAG